jgi:mono/diheme cytochrome c family protein
MRRWRLRRISLVLAVGAFGLTAATAVRASDLAAGQRVYERQCASCHGIDGRPTMPRTPDFSRGESLQVSDVEMVGRIKTGKDLMPGYDRVISDDDILNVIAYIRTLWF